MINLSQIARHFSTDNDQKRSICPKLIAALAQAKSPPNHAPRKGIPGGCGNTPCPKSIATPVNVLISGAGHIPPPAERVLEKMEAFFRWYGAARGALHPVEFAARVHADFVNIHPFKDGNGRTARLIMNFELMRVGFPTVIVPVDARPDYYRNLDIAATQGDYLPFVMQIAELAQKSFAPYGALLGE